MTDYAKISEYIYNCNICHTRCDSKSKGIYTFENDAALSEAFEDRIINSINQTTKHKASKCNTPGYPDIIINKKDNTTIYLEVKVQQRTFMQVKKHLPQSGLKPSETVALNLSDLKRYFEIARRDNVKIIIVWVLKNRLCIIPEDEFKLFYQDNLELEKIYNTFKDKRRFRRKSGEGDIVEGIHKGVTVNYHFSLNELILWENFKI